ncbi:MAG: RagB/SusD family nutrient uptake outer membrane protein [Bacteroidota bacterium]
MKKIFIYLLPVLFLSSCDYLEPRPIQDQTDDDLWTTSFYGEGILTTAYTSLNTMYPVSMDYYTDNAVPSVAGANNLALGSWTVENNPIGDWAGYYNNLKYLNIFLEKGRNLVYIVSDPVTDSAYKINRIGEAFFLRAWYHWELLKNYGGKVDGRNEVYGVPIVNKVLTVEDNYDLPRATYEEVVDQILADCDSAYDILPFRYNGSETYNSNIQTGRANGLAALALKARVCLSAASPAYGPSSTELWERAAQAAYDAISADGGLVELGAYGDFNNDKSEDMIWVQPSYTGNTEENLYYPPSLYGDGSCNPSQNLVDLFPAADGYPITESTAYDPSDPYANRDPRFNRFIFFNGDVYNKTTVATYEGGADAPGGLSQQGTRTGYYLKKLTSSTVKLTPGKVTAAVKFYVFLARTELYLNFAEAANEAYGPNAGPFDFTAADAMRIIRTRAGIDSDPATEGYQDQYLEDQVAAGKEAFRDFIQDNRRIELCFEGFRFWDIRRWNLPLNHTVKGVKITDNSGTYSYDYVDVEEHSYQDYMRYVPLPYYQTLIMSDLPQNSGWE